MDLHTQIEKLLGFNGSWNPTRNLFRVDPLSYGYLVPIKQVELEAGGVLLRSSPVTNTEWWHQFGPVSSCPRYKGQLIEIEDRYNPFCREGNCSELCHAEDGFVDLSAGRLRLQEDAEHIQHRFPRLQHFLERAEKLTEEYCQKNQVRILFDTSDNIVELRSRLRPESDAVLTAHIQTFKELYPLITGVQGKVNTAFLPQTPDYSDVDITDESVLEEGRYYALQEAVRQEAIDILHFLVERKGGTITENEYYMPENQMIYILWNNRIEATRKGLYMGNEGFKKGVQEIQKFFQTTLGGGRW